MNKIASYLQSHLSGEVLDSPSVREYFSTDASIVQMKPTFVIHPRSTNDVRKVARFSWQLAEKGHKLPITARGSGTDQTGGAVGKGVLLVFPTHLNRILELDTQQRLVRVQPGVNFKSLQETLQTHGLFMPSFPASYAYSTVGGAVANNSAGEKSLKYGPITEWVEKLEVVLANGEMIQTGRISKKGVQKKKGLATLEGEIYRVVDGLLDEYEEHTNAYYDNLIVSKDNVGYDLRDIKRRDGSIDLTSLFVGSQGTLGVITEMILRVIPHNPHTGLVVGALENFDGLAEVVDKLRHLTPSSLEMIDQNLVQFAEKERGFVFPKELVDEDKKPAVILFVEFDDERRHRDKKVRSAVRELKKLTDKVVVSNSLEEQEKLWAIRHVASAVLNYSHNGKVAVPFMEDATVPPERLADLIRVAEKLFEKYHLSFAVWGHAGDANLHMHPMMDLSKLADRQKILKLMDEYFLKVLQLGGSMAGEHNDGRVRAPFVRLQVGSEMYELFEKLRVGFDPHGILNPGVKTGTDVKQFVSILRKEYSLSHLADYLPRT